MTTVPYTFGNETSPIPLSELDANFAVTPQFANTAGNVSNAAQPNITSVGTLTSLSVTGNVASGNVTTVGSISATGNVTTGNIRTGGLISAYGTVTGGSFSTVGNINGANVVATGYVQAAGNVSGSNLVTSGNITSTGTMSAQGNVLAQGIISATGNIVTAANFVGNFLGNITGNLTLVTGSNTQVLFNSNGNVGAAGGLTYTTGPNTLGILGVVSAQGNITGGNLRVNGTTQLVGAVTAPTPSTATSNNQVATTAFVSNRINTLGVLGTMAAQDASNVAITGGDISVSNIAGVAQFEFNGGWAITPSGNTLYFSFSGTNVATLDSSGNFTTIGNVTASGTV
jgi:hypothetical protein